MSVRGFHPTSRLGFMRHQELKEHVASVPYRLSWAFELRLNTACILMAICIATANGTRFHMRARRTSSDMVKESNTIGSSIIVLRLGGVFQGRSLLPRYMLSSALAHGLQAFDNTDVGWTDKFIPCHGYLGPCS
jgi:hypothetical protein